MTRSLAIVAAVSWSSESETVFPIHIAWDGVEDFLSIVQKRFKTVNSLRDPKTLEEYSLAELQCLVDKSIVLGSVESSQLRKCEPTVATDGDGEDKGDSSKSKASVVSLRAVHENGLKLTKLAQHATKAKEEVIQCYESGSQHESSDSHPRKVTSVRRMSDVANRDSDVAVTTCATTMDTLPSPADEAQTLRKLGLFHEMRTQLHILLRYNDKAEAFELSGNTRVIAMAKKRLESLRRGTTSQCTVKVPSPNDTCGKVIGKGGSTIKTIRKICKLGGIDVRWEETIKQIVLTTIGMTSHQAGNRLMT